MFVPLKKEEEKPLPRLDSDEDYPTLAQAYLSSNQISISSIVPNEASAPTAADSDSDSKPLLAFNVAAVQPNNHEFVKSIGLVKKEQSVPKTVRRFKKGRRISFAEFEESLLAEASDSQYDDDFLNPESDFNYTAFSDEYDMKKNKLR
ncbi:hypothetical protein WICPIJ_002157 [Wickerhamomyces pijperi]|uniref:Uncharacterized protein n=1 Tax=Wickerhamomyces pijperi TaxID=599730 RepID=A0A9P8QCC3_WICPI|nr:hypothetical protein WICPIJ_002157 [Wickerhamomyces pijperi]